MSPILPNALKDLLEAPIPFIIGMNRPAEDAWHLLENSVNAIVILLDTGEIIDGQEQILAKLPKSIGNLYKELDGPYKMFEMKKIQKGNCKEIQYCPNERQLIAVTEICKTIEQNIKEIIIGKLPEYHELSNSKIELEEIKSRAKKMVLPENSEFVEKFIDTQMFANYVEEHYNYFK